MALNWNSVRSEHVAQACEQLRSSTKTARGKAKGIFVIYQDETLPAKRVLRLAYCIANRLPVTSQVKFTSGDSTLNLLRKLGFSAERRRPPTTETSA